MRPTQVLTTALVCSALTPLAGAAALNLDASNAYFSDDAETGALGDQWGQGGNGPGFGAGSDSLMQYSSGQAHSGSRSIYYNDPAPSDGGKRILGALSGIPDGGADAVDYGVRIWFNVPTGAQLDNNLFAAPRLRADTGVGNLYRIAGRITESTNVDDPADTIVFKTFGGTGGAGTVEVPVARDTWHSVQIDHLLESDGGNVDVYLNGVLVQDNWYTTQDSFNEIQLGDENNNGYGQVFYDDVLVAPVPEPASAALLAAGGVVAGLRRRR